MNGIFNIFEKTQEEITDFEQKGHYIVGKPSTPYEPKSMRGKRGGYYFSQREVLEAVDLATASKFRKGPYDDEGQRKAYINIVCFFRDVAKMKIGIKVSNYILEPRSLSFTWPVWLKDREFKIWADEESYDDQLDDQANDLATYGTTVSKKVKYGPERVPLRSIRNTQTSKSLFHAASSGGYVHIDNDFHFNEMEPYAVWDTEDLDVSKSYNVIERYGLVPEGLVKNYQNMSMEQILTYKRKKDERMVLAIACLIPADGPQATGGKHVLFMEALDEDSWPLEECHTERIDGRWLGKGEVEKQLENQLARNMNAHLRRRGLLWATKQIFQSTDENVQKNLVMEVKDGEVLHVKPNGQLTRVNTSSQHAGDINADEASWKENSQQISFAFESATGESMPSGTPFSLGVILQQAVASHFARLKMRYSNYLKRSFFDQILPTFDKEYRHEHELVLEAADDLENLKEEMIVYHTNVRIFDAVVKRRRYDPLEIRSSVETELARSPYLGIQIPARFYEKAEHYMKLNLTDDTGPDITTLTTIYQGLLQKGDPRADRVLSLILAKGGKSLGAIIGKPPAAPTAPPTEPAPSEGFAPAPTATAADVPAV